MNIPKRMLMGLGSFHFEECEAFHVAFIQGFLVTKVLLVGKISAN